MEVKPIRRKGCLRPWIKYLPMLLLAASGFGDYEADGLLFYFDAARPGPRPTYNIDTNSPNPRWAETMTGAYCNFVGVNTTNAAHFPLWTSSDVYNSTVYFDFGFEADSWGGRLYLPNETYGSARFDYDDDFSVEIWVRPGGSSSSASGRMHLFGDQTTDGQGYRLTAQEVAGGLFRVEFEMQDVTGSTATYYCVTDADFEMGQWHQVLAVYDGQSGSSPDMKIYVDGVDQVATYAGDMFCPADTDFIPEATQVAVGARGTGSTPVLDADRHYLDGDVSVIRVYTNVLSAQSVAENYMGCRARFAGETVGWLPGADFHTNAVPEYRAWTNGVGRSRMMRLPADRRITIVDEPGHYFCRADVTRTSSGRLICAFLDNSDHSGRGDSNDFSHVAFSVSDDDGDTWFNPNNSSESYGIIRSGYWATDGRGHKVVNISYHPDLGPNGVAVINTATVYNDEIYPDTDTHQIHFWSYDDGNSWTTQSLVNLPMDNVSPDRIRVLDNGDWVILGHSTRSSTVWLPDARSELTMLRSKDQGQTWQPVSDVVQSQDHKAWHESSLYDAGDGRLVVFMDDLTREAYPAFRCYSRDYGSNFSPPVMAPWFAQKNESGLLRNGKAFNLFRTHGMEEGYTAWLGDAFDTNNVMPVTSFCYNQDRIRLYPDRLTLDSGEGNFEATMYTLPPTVDPQDHVIFKTRMRFLSGNTNACHIDVGLPVMIRTNRIELLDNPAIGFDVDTTQWRDLEIDRDGETLVIKCDDVVHISTNVSVYVQNSGLTGDSAGRTIKFGNYTEQFKHEKFENNAGVSEWAELDVTMVSEFFPSYHWVWSVEDGVYPDQYKRDRLIMLEPEGADWSSDYGYGGWVQMPDDSIYIVDYTHGEEGTVEDRGGDPFLRGYRMFESDFDFAPNVAAELHLDAEVPGSIPETVWEPLVGSGGTLVAEGGTNYLPQLGSVSNITCYTFTCASNCGGQVSGLSTGGGQFDYDDDFSIEAWVKPQQSVASSGRMHIIGNQPAGEDNAACGWRLTAREVLGTGTFFFELTMRDNAGEEENRATYQVKSETYSMNQWHHVVAIYEGITNALPMMRLYVDGAPASLVVQGNANIPVAGERDFVVTNQVISVGTRGRLGGFSATDDARHWFGGSIAEVRLYPEALNRGQVVAQYAAETFVPPLTELHLDASMPGDDPDTVWTPLVGTGGMLQSTGGVSYLPELDLDDQAECYTFSCASNCGGQVIGLATNCTQFDVDDSFTVEAWVKPDESIATSGRMHIVGNQMVGGGYGGCGWRLTARQTEGAETFSVELEMRDNVGSGTNAAIYLARAGTWPMHEWHHIAAVYEGSSNGVPQFSMVVDGEVATLVLSNDDWVPSSGEQHFVAPGQDVVVGARGRIDYEFADNESRHWFGGDIAEVRVVPGVESTQELIESYLADMQLWLDATQPGTEPDRIWMPVYGAGGKLSCANQPAWLPRPEVMDGLACYHFVCSSNLGGQVSGLTMGPGSGRQFDYDDQFSVEAWVNPQQSVASSGRMHIIGNQPAGDDNASCGWRLTAREVLGTGEFFFELTMRDGNGSGTNAAVLQVKTSDRYAMAEWHHVIAAYEGQSNALPSMAIYVDGEESELVVQGASWIPPEGERDFVVTNQVLLVGARGPIDTTTATDDSRHWFGGGISVVRLYPEAFDESEIETMLGSETAAASLSQNILPISQEPVEVMAMQPSSASLSLQDESSQLWLDADLPGSEPSVIWKPVQGFGGALYASGGPEWLPRHKTLDDLSCYAFSSASNVGGQVAELSMGDGQQFDYDDDFTVEVWMKPQSGSSASDRMHVVGNLLTGDAPCTDCGWQITVCPIVGTDRFFIEMSMKDGVGSSVVYEVQTEAFLMDEWHQMVAVYDGTAESVPQMQIYVDGRKAALTGPENLSVPPVGERHFAVAGQEITVGACGRQDLPFTDAQRGWFNGALSVVRIYPEAFDKEQIKDLIDKK